MADKLVTIAKYADYMRAELAKQFLEDCGIEAVVMGANASNIYSFVPMMECELQVFENKAKEALEILDSMEHDPAENIDMPEEMESDLDEEDEDENT